MDNDFTTVTLPARRSAAPDRAPAPKPRRSIPLTLFLVLSAWFFEGVLIVSVPLKVNLTLILSVLVFGACAGLLASSISRLFKSPKVNGVIVGILLFLGVVFFCVETLCFRVYGNFMNVSTITRGTGGVIRDFKADIIDAIRRGIGVIMLYLIPLVVFIALAAWRRVGLGRSTHAIRLLSLAAAVFLFLGGHFAVQADATARQRYASNYRYDTAVRAFGLFTGTRLDVQYLLFGNPAAGEFVMPEFAGLPAAPEDEGEDVIRVISRPTQPAPAPAPAASEAAPAASQPAESLTEPAQTEALPAAESPAEPAPTEAPVTEAPVTETALPETPAPQPAVPNPQASYAEHTMGIDFAALAGSLGEPAATLSRYVSTLTPAATNAYTGMFAGKNLIFISAEAFCAELIRPDLTPMLYRLSTKGMQFTEYYQPAWGGSTSTGEFSNLVGLVPANGIDDMLQSGDKNLYFTMGNQLQRLGYFSAAYHDHDGTYYGRYQTHTNLGYSTFKARDDLPITHTWPESDLEMMQATVDEYINQEHFSVYYMSVSGHRRYQWDQNEIARKNRDAVAGIGGSEHLQTYFACNLEFEYAIEYLVNRLEQAGKADDTVIVIAADHWPYGMEDYPVPGYKNALGELYGYDYTSPWERDHNRLIIWSGCLEDSAPIVVSQPTYSLDILPTLSNLFGLTYDSRLMIGRDVFDPASTPLVIWGDYSWLTDKAVFDCLDGTVHPRPGHEAEVTQDYIHAVSSRVANAFTFSRGILACDYYRILFGDDVNR